jgi:hypothetical protein
MIITERFNWLHIPKTAGSKTRRLLLGNAVGRTNKLLYNAAEDQGGSAMHTHIIPDKYNINKRPTAMNVRRLNDLILSHNSFFLHHAFTGGGFKSDLWDRTKEHTLKGEIYDWLNTSKDMYIRVDEAYKSFLAIKNVKYLRSEFLAQDICDWLQDLNIIIDEDAIFKDTARVNGNKFPQPNIIDRDLSIMYNNNPLWAELEKELYES